VCTIDSDCCCWLRSLQAFERNAILENELDEKQRLPEMCQRLKDEVKGEQTHPLLKPELYVSFPLSIPLPHLSPSFVGQNFDRS
jgi:hypothetical protein